MQNTTPRRHLIESDEDGNSSASSDGGGVDCSSATIDTTDADTTCIKTESTILQIPIRAKPPTQNLPVAQVVRGAPDSKNSIDAGDARKSTRRSARLQNKRDAALKGRSSSNVKSTPNKHTPEDPIFTSALRDFASLSISRNSNQTPRSKAKMMQTGDVTPQTPSQIAQQTAKKRTRLQLLPRPVPDPSYLAQASRTPVPLEETKKLLIVLDLNGVLIHRRSARSIFTPRPGLFEFLDYLFENHHVVVWSSAKTQRVHSICAEIFSPEQQAKLVAVWGRESLQLGIHADADVQVYKQLQWLWDPIKKDEFLKGTVWDQTNTIIIEDDAVKAAKHPYNVMIVDEYVMDASQVNDGTFEAARKYLQDLSRTADVSNFIHQKPFRYVQRVALTPTIAPWAMKGGQSQIVMQSVTTPPTTSLALGGHQLSMSTHSRSGCQPVMSAQHVIPGSAISRTINNGDQSRPPTQDVPSSFSMWPDIAVGHQPDMVTRHGKTSQGRPHQDMVKSQFKSTPWSSGRMPKDP